MSFSVLLANNSCKSIFSSVILDISLKTWYIGVIPLPPAIPKILLTFFFSPSELIISYSRQHFLLEDSQNCQKDLPNESYLLQLNFKGKEWTYLHLDTWYLYLVDRSWQVHLEFPELQTKYSLMNRTDRCIFPCDLLSIRCIKSFDSLSHSKMLTNM